MMEEQKEKTANKVIEVIDLIRLTELIRQPEKGTLEKLEVFLKKSSNKEIANYLMRFSVRNSNISALKLCIEYGADIKSRDDEGNTLLHYAVGSKNLNTVKFIYGLVSTLLPLQMNEKNNRKITPLLAISFIKNLDDNDKAKDIIIFLCEKGANVNDIDKDGSTLLHYSTSDMRGNINITNSLLELGADPDIIDKYKSVPFERVKGNAPGWTKKQQDEILDIMLQSRRNLKFINTALNTEQHFSI